MSDVRKRLEEIILQCGPIWDTDRVIDQILREYRLEPIAYDIDMVVHGVFCD